MDASKVKKFMSMMGCKNIIQGSRWVKSNCIMGHLHNGGSDNVGSFAISITPGDSSNCRCLGCGIYGDLLSFVWKMKTDLGKERPDLFNFLLEHNQINTDKLKLDEDHEPTEIRGRIKQARKYISKPYTVGTNFTHPDDEPQASVPEHVLDQMKKDMPDNVFRYLTRPDDPLFNQRGRGLSPQSVKDWELGWHRMNNRICIPIRDEDGKLVAISGRAYGNASGPKYLHSRFKRDRILYGEHKRVPSVRKGFLFEGFFHVIYTSQFGYVNLLARMGTHLSKEQARKLVMWFDHLVIVPDGDVPGRNAAQRDARNLADLSYEGEEGEIHTISRIDIIEVPNKKDIDSLNPEQVKAILGPSNNT